MCEPARVASRRDGRGGGDAAVCLTFVEPWPELTETVSESSGPSKKPSSASPLRNSLSSFIALYWQTGRICQTQSSKSCGLRRTVIESSSTPSADMKSPFDVWIVM